ncbi:MAG: hypothetical protein U0797_06670 [Gemmataceae bacterium]
MADVAGLDVPGLEGAGASAARWFVPVAALAALAVGAIFYFNRDSPTLNVPGNPGGEAQRPRLLQGDDRADGEGQGRRFRPHRGAGA